jgi:uncharacterized cupin superfamily protein
MANLFKPEFEESSDRDGFTYKRAKLGAQTGAERLGASLYELPPGEANFPYHAHFGNEELLIIIAGHPSLRTEQGWRELEPGEAVAFPSGPKSPHQVQNRSEEPARILMISEMHAPDVVLYPDSGKILAGTRPPGGANREEDIYQYFRLTDSVDYWEGEKPPPEGPWP